MDKKLFVFDFDGTIINQDSSNILFKKIDFNFKKTEDLWKKGTITSIECMKRHTKCLKGLEKNKLKVFIKRITINNDFFKLVKFLKKNKFDLIILSDGLKPNIDFFKLNTTIPNIICSTPKEKNGVFTGELITVNTSKQFKIRKNCIGCCTCKAKIVKKLKNKFSYVAMVGDGKSDECMFQYSDISFSRNSKIKADIYISSFQDIIKYFKNMKKNEKLIKKVVKSINSKYGLKIENFKIINIGKTNLAAKLFSGKKKYFLRIYSKKTSEKSTDYINFELDALELLKKNNLKVVTPVHDSFNNRTNKIENHDYVVFPFIEGKPAKQKIVTTAKEVGFALGLIHKIGLKFSGNPKIRDSNLPTQKIKFCLRKKVPKEFKEKIKILYETHRFDYPGLSFSIAHGDIIRDNFIFEKNKIKAILDFDDCYYGPIVYDVADAIIRWCVINDKDIKISFIKELIKKYSINKKLSEKDIFVLYDAIFVSLASKICSYIIDSDFNESKNLILDDLKIVELFKKMGRKKFTGIIQSQPLNK